MTYKERYRQSHAKEIKRHGIIRNVMQYVALIIFSLAMLTAMTGIAMLDGRTMDGVVLMISGSAVMALIIRFAGWLEEGEE